MNSAYKRVEEEIRNFIQVPERIQSLCCSATSDLYFGPNEVDENYPGFSSAIKEIRNWVDNIPYHLWVDSDCGAIWEREPETIEVDGENIEPFWDSIYFLERKDILKTLFDSELVSYL